MTDVDVSQIKVGDVVGVRVARSDDGIYVSLGNLGGGSDFTIRLNPDAIVSHTPAPKPALKVGDRVTDPARGVREVVCAAGASIWLAPTDALNDIRRRPLSEVETWERV